MPRIQVLDGASLWPEVLTLVRCGTLGQAQALKRTVLEDHGLASIERLDCEPFERCSLSPIAPSKSLRHDERAGISLRVFDHHGLRVLIDRSILRSIGGQD